MSAPQTVTETHQGLLNKKFSALELTRDFIKSIRQEKLNAFLTVCEERALEHAKKADQVLASKGQAALATMPLLGVPVAVKDVLVLENVRTTCGSKILENYLPPYTATALQRLESAGAVILGKLNMDEFAMGGSNENSAYGPVKHPTHPDRVPGGSSGGSAAAVKAGLCVASLGTDTGGSIRLPASFCGLVGMKPTYGRVSRYGLVAFASSLDQIGPFTNTVQDAAVFLDVMSGHDPKDSTSLTKPALKCREALSRPLDWKKIRVGVPKEYFVGGLSAAVQKSIEESLKFFEKKGAKLVDVSLPHTQYAVAVYYLVAVSEASSNLARYDGVRFGSRPKSADQAKDLTEFYKKVRSQFGAEVKRRIILGTFALSSGYYDAYYKRACQVRHLIKKDFDSAFASVDFLAAPVSPATAFKLGEKISDPLQMYLNDIFTIPANLAGLPALSVPCGQDEQGLPIGLHLMAPAFADEQLLTLAHAFQTERS